jgi:glycosyltransferase involved in cell wall biosynthesis
MDYGPNDDAALRLVQDILPKVRAQVPSARLTIAGRSPTERLKAAAAAQPGVSVTGFVDDMRDYLERAELFVCPLRYGAGMQNKVLEALAMEVPVAASSLAAEGLRFEGHEPPLCVADDPQQMADRVAHLLANPAERARLSRAGRQYIEEHFSWARSAEKLEQLCLAAVESARSDRKSLLHV